MRKMVFNYQMEIEKRTRPLEKKLKGCQIVLKKLRK